ncbi:hypothetical protein TNCV_1861011 [Trichonephila clavipes]|nr:hypothetical protein TNCV_1861011 [Trichonephila clavipes]
MHWNGIILNIFTSILYYVSSEDLRKKNSKIGEIGNGIEEVVDQARQINLEGISDAVQELLVSNNQDLTVDEIIEMHDREQDIEELESLDPIQSEDRMTAERYRITKAVGSRVVRASESRPEDLVPCLNCGGGDQWCHHHSSIREFLRA